MKTALLTAVGSASAGMVIERLHALGLRVVGCDIYPRAWITASAARISWDASTNSAGVRGVTTKSGRSLISPHIARRSSEIVPQARKRNETPLCAASARQSGP